MDAAADMIEKGKQHLPEVLKITHAGHNALSVVCVAFAAATSEPLHNFAVTVLLPVRFFHFAKLSLCLQSSSLPLACAKPLLAGSTSVSLAESGPCVLFYMLSAAWASLQQALWSGPLPA